MRPGWQQPYLELPDDDRDESDDDDDDNDDREREFEDKLKAWLETRPRIKIQAPILRQSDCAVFSCES